jgi:hypothetical protein
MMNLEQPMDAANLPSEQTTTSLFPVSFPRRRMAKKRPQILLSKECLYHVVLRVALSQLPSGFIGSLDDKLELFRQAVGQAMAIFYKGPEIIKAVNPFAPLPHTTANNLPARVPSLTAAAAAQAITGLVDILTLSLDANAIDVEERRRIVFGERSPLDREGLKALQNPSIIGLKESDMPTSQILDDVNRKLRRNGKQIMSPREFEFDWQQKKPGPEGPYYNQSGAIRAVNDKILSKFLKHEKATPSCASYEHMVLPDSMEQESIPPILPSIRSDRIHIYSLGDDKIIPCSRAESTTDPMIFVPLEFLSVLVWMAVDLCPKHMMLDNDCLEKQTALFHNGSKEIRLVKPIVDGAIIASFSSYQVSNQQPMDLHQAARYSVRSVQRLR